MNKKRVLFVVIILLAFLLRIFLLGVVPPGLTNDEADIGYDAYSILKTGRDQWGEAFPLIAFKGFGDYRLPLYTYLVVPVISIFDLSTFSVRIPSAIFGTISVGLMYFLSRKLTDKSEASSEIISYSAMSLMAFSPWSIGLSRIGIESNVAITFFLVGIIVFLNALKNPKLYFISIFFFALTIYTYTSYMLFTPISLIILLWYFRKKIFSYKKQVFASIVLFILLLTPLFIFRSAAGVRASQVTYINSPDNIGISANLNDRRGSCAEVFPDIACKVFENKYVVIGNTFVRNYINHFSPDFLYINGTTTQFSILPQRSLLFTIELLAFITGLAAILKGKIKNGFLIILLLLASPLPDTLTGDGHFSRAANMQPFIFLVEGGGVSFAYLFFKSKGNKYSVSAVVGLLFLLSCIAFLVSYFSYFPKHYSSFGQYGYEDLSSKLSEKKKEYDKIYISKFSNDTKQYIYFLFYNKYDPSNFQDKRDIEYSNDNGWVSIDRLENLYFVDRLPSEKEILKLSSKDVLFVSHPKEFPEGFKFTDTIVDKNGNGVFTFVDLSVYLQFLENQKLFDKDL